MFGGFFFEIDITLISTYFDSYLKKHNSYFVKFILYSVLEKFLKICLKSYNKYLRVMK